MTLPGQTIDILIFVVFFLLNIIVGSKYRGKKQSFKEYAIGDKKFSTAYCHYCGYLDVWQPIVSRS
jgi:Na+/proline symporter